MFPEAPISGNELNRPRVSITGGLAYSQISGVGASTPTSPNGLNLSFQQDLRFLWLALSWPLSESWCLQAGSCPQVVPVFPTVAYSALAFRTVLRLYNLLCSALPQNILSKDSTSKTLPDQGMISCLLSCLDSTFLGRNGELRSNCSSACEVWGVS